MKRSMVTPTILVAFALVVPRFQNFSAQGGAVTVNPSCDSKTVTLDCTSHLGHACTDSETVETTSQRAQQRYIAGATDNVCKNMQANQNLSCNGMGARPASLCEPPPPEVETP